ncbi:hypothetical protein AAFF_G00265660 [Aldrovandia affinis]|uniref:Uncharacterized protein n=1 Tax=Aldrovandia affinis TaxID=143900 RepID=A0AAD7RBD2_9TELE|nr:hypothetical protein AAFF_G00265660 [Aldrovandia affinis]
MVNLGDVSRAERFRMIGALRSFRCESPRVNRSPAPERRKPSIRDQSAGVKHALETSSSPPPRKPPFPVVQAGPLVARVTQFLDSQTSQQPGWGVTCRLPCFWRGGAQRGREEAEITRRSETRLSRGRRDVAETDLCERHDSEWQEV